MIKEEIKKSIVNVFFVITCILGSTLSIIHSIKVSIEYKELYSQITDQFTINQSFHTNPCFPIFTVFNLWIGRDNDSSLATFFFFFLPLLAAVPYSWSYCSDLKKGIIEKNIFCFRNYFSKFIAVFVSSGLVIAIPLIINFIGMTLFVPAIKPDSVFDIYYNISSESFCSLLFYEYPVFYVVFFIVLNFVFYGLLGCLSLSFSTIVKNRVVSMFFPSFLLLLMEVIEKFLFQNINIEISPISFLFPLRSSNANGIVIITEIAILLLFSLIYPLTRGDEIEA